MLKLKRARRLPPHLWTQPPAQSWLDTGKVIKQLAGRWEAYHAASIDPIISEYDDMLGKGESATAEYNKTGLSALQIISEAMLASGATEFKTILDLPCGGGRVTRHLRAFFPDSKIYVSDIDKNKENAVSRQFGAITYDCPPDFTGTCKPQFDLIFSGSLLTHFDRDFFERSLDYFIGSLNRGGIAVLTLHGRASASRSLQPGTMDRLLENKKAFINHFKAVKSKPSYNIDPERAIKEDFVKDGFGYFATPAWTDMYKQSYGGSYTSPSWIMELIQNRDDCLVLSYKEVSYGDSQDVLCLYRL